MRGLFGALTAPARKEDPRTLDQLPGFLLNTESATGISVTWATALQVTTMFACARVIGEGMAQSRCRLMRPRRGRPGADRASDVDLDRLLFLEPSAGITAFSFWETICFHLLFVGNAFVFVNRMGDRRVHELINIDPGRVKVTRLDDLSLRYAVTGDDGSTRPMPPGSIWHIRGPSWNGWMGLETVKVAREALGLSMALEAAHSRMHKDGAKQSGVYSINGELTAAQYDQLSAWLKKFAQAASGEPMILDRGATWLSQQMKGVDQEHLDTRRFQIEEICRPVRVMPMMIGLTDKTATYASVEQMLIAHVTHCLAPTAGRLEQAVEVGLLTDREKREGLFAKFNLNALMRGSFKDRQEGLQIQRRNGIIHADEWRDLEDMNPRQDGGGEQYIVEANMAIQDGRDLPPPTAPTKKPAEA